MTSKSGNESVGLTGPMPNFGGTAGHLPAGYSLREFQIDQVLGEGGFSVVYLATDTRLERRVAIKEYMPTALATRNPDLSVHVRSSAQHREAFDAGLRSFINEAKLLARFEHRALVKVHQFWQEKGTAYMVMPYYAGPTLKTWIKRHHEPVDATWLEQFVRLVMDAVETLHRENCLHRDVAPDNILILNERSPLLLDFGAARRVIGDLTQALTVILKPGFAPIEQYAESQSMRQGPWTDVYALCAVAHFMITGRAPTPSVTRVLADDLVPLSAAAEGRFPPAFLAALDAGLTVRPQQRPQSIAALRELMNGAAPEDTLTSRPAAAAAPTPGPVPSTIRPLPQTAPAEQSGADAAASADYDDDRTRIATTRDLGFRTAPGTISSPEQPALAPVEVESTEPIEGDPNLGTRFPSRSLREHEVTAGHAAPEDDEDRGLRLPLLIGGVAIAVVIGGAWALIDWMDSQFEQSRSARPVSTPAPAPAPPPAPSPATAPRTAQSPVTNAAPAVVMTPASPAATAAVPPTVTAAPTPAQASTPAPSAAPATAATRAGPPASPVPAAEDTKKAVPEKSIANAAPTPAPASPTSPIASSPPATPPIKSETKVSASPAPAPAAKPETRPESLASAGKASVSSPTTATPLHPPTAQTTKSTTPAPSDPRPATAQTDARPANGQMGQSVSKSGAPSSADPARARPNSPPPATTTAAPYQPSEPPLAPPVSVPPVATVDAPALPPQVAAVERARPAVPPAPVLFKPLSQPKPMFPREALRANVDKGTVTARLFVAADGTVSKVEIVSSYPSRVFDREVLDTLKRWRFEAPGQPGQIDVPLDFDRFK